VTEQPDRKPLTVLVYSDDAATREKVRLAVGRRPAADLGRVEYVDVDTGPGVVEELDGGGYDLAILDGEAWPEGGIGLCHQLKDELDDSPPILILVGRRDDAWLAAWSRADGTLSHPLEPVETAATVANLLRQRVQGVPTRRG
jgi:DNA-binding response OmpR family regulator